MKKQLVLDQLATGRLNRRKPLSMVGVDGKYVATLRKFMEKEKTTKGGLAIDLTEVTLVSQEAVDALAVAEANRIELRDCPFYVREWVSRANDNHD